MNANIMQSNNTLRVIDEQREFASVRIHNTFINHRNYDDIAVMQEDHIHSEWVFFALMALLMLAFTILMILVSRWFLIILIIIFIVTIVCIIKSYLPKPVSPWHISFSYESSSGTIPVAQV